MKAPGLVGGDRRIDTDGFESFKGSQPPRSLPGDSPHSTKSRHFRRLAVKSLVSGENVGRLSQKALESGRVSLLPKFSISEICMRERPETGFVSAETGSEGTRTRRCRQEWPARVRFKYSPIPSRSGPRSPGCPLSGLSPRPARQETSGGTSDKSVETQQDCCRYLRYNFGGWK
jgi:hypothetical protein